MNDDSAAIGVVVSGNGDVGTEGGPCPRLTYHLPGWLLRDISGPADASDSSRKAGVVRVETIEDDEFHPAHLPPNVA